MKSLATLICLGLALPATCQTPAEPTPPKLRIGALNIEWLGQPHRRARPAKDVAQDPKDIAEYIKASGVSILALEEICDDDGVAETHTNKTLSNAIAVLNDHGDAKWKYRLIPKNPQSEGPTIQLLGLAWNEAVVTPVKLADGSEWYRPHMEMPTDSKVIAPGKPAFERWTCGMKFSAGPGKTDVVVLPIHLKSNRPAFEGQDTSAQRELEAKMLLAALPDIKAKFGDEDIIIIGDTNFMNRREKAIAALVSGGFVDTNAADEDTYVTDTYKSPFDRAFIPNPEQPSAKEFAHTRQDVFKHPTMNAPTYRKRISDHRMIRITVDVMDDDD